MKFHRMLTRPNLYCLPSNVAPSRTLERSQVGSPGICVLHRFTRNRCVLGLVGDQYQKPVDEGTRALVSKLESALGGCCSLVTTYRGRTSRQGSHDRSRELGWISLILCRYLSIAKKASQAGRSISYIVPSNARIGVPIRADGR
jgi:hypothetical protein